MLSSFWRAAAYCVHPKIILLSLIPIAILALGFVATTIANPASKNGILYGGGWSVLGTQTLGVVAVLAYSFTVTLVIGSWT